MIEKLKHVIIFDIFYLEIILFIYFWIHFNAIMVVIDGVKVLLTTICSHPSDLNLIVQ